MDHREEGDLLIAIAEETEDVRDRTTAEDGGPVTIAAVANVAAAGEGAAWEEATAATMAGVEV